VLWGGGNLLQKIQRNHWPQTMPGSRPRSSRCPDSAGRCLRSRILNTLASTCIVIHSPQVNQPRGEAPRRRHSNTRRRAADTRIQGASRRADAQRPRGATRAASRRSACPAQASPLPVSLAWAERSGWAAASRIHGCRPHPRVSWKAIVRGPAPCSMSTHCNACQIGDASVEGRRIR